MVFKKQNLSAQRLDSAVLSYTIVCVKEKRHFTALFRELQV